MLRRAEGWRPRERHGTDADDEIARWRDFVDECRGLGGGLRRMRVRGLACTQFGAYLIGATYNLLRITNLRRQLCT